VQRLEVRLEPDRYARLRRIAEERHRSMSDVVRELIDDAYAEIERARRIAAARRLGEMELFDVGTPEELKAEILTMWDERIPDDFR
jgi:predicted transcriptional regulator